MGKTSRLSRSDFAAIQALHVKKEHGAHFSAFFGVLPGQRSGVRIACVVSKKTAKLASERNRIKRRCRAVAKEVFSLRTEPLFAVFIAKRSAAEAALGSIRSDITALARKAG